MQFSAISHFHSWDRVGEYTLWRRVFQLPRAVLDRGSKEAQVAVDMKWQQDGRVAGINAVVWCHLIFVFYFHRFWISSKVVKLKNFIIITRWSSRVSFPGHCSSWGFSLCLNYFESILSWVWVWCGFHGPPQFHFLKLLIFEFFLQDYWKVWYSCMNLNVLDVAVRFWAHKHPCPRWPSAVDWVQEIAPSASMLKFRLPYKKGQTDYLDGWFVFPVWGGQGSSST